MSEETPAADGAAGAAPASLPPSPLQLRVITDVYHTYVTKEPLYDPETGKPAAGNLVWNKYILISSHIPLESREDAWFHEAHHAWDFAMGHLQNDGGVEKGANRASSITRGIMEDYLRQGGRATLMALTPIEGLAPPAPKVCSQPPTPKINDDELLRHKFPDLDDLCFAMAKKMWEAERLDPWKNRFFVKVLWTSKGPQIAIVPRISELRVRAHATKQYAGHEPPRFVYGEDAKIPEMCTFVGYRLVAGEKQRFEGEATWAEAYGYDIDRLDPLVQQKPRLCLSRCAEADFFRRAFPEETGGFYVKEELLNVPKQPPRVAAKTIPGINGVSSARGPLPAAYAPAVDPEDLPQSSGGLHRRMIELGFKVEADRKRIIMETQEEFGQMQDGREPDFYAAVIRVTKRSLNKGGASGGTPKE